MKTAIRILMTMLNIALLGVFIAAGAFAWQHRDHIEQTVTYHRTGMLTPLPQDVRVEIQDLAGNVLFRGDATEHERATALFPGRKPEIHTILFEGNFRLGTAVFTLKVDPTGDRGWLSSDVEWSDLEPYLLTDAVELQVDRPNGTLFKGTIKSFMAQVAQDGKATPFGQELDQERPVLVAGVLDVRHPEHIKGKVRVETIYDPR